MLKLTIVEAGLPPEPIRDKYPEGYPKMFETLFRETAPDMTFETVRLEHGDRLMDPEGLEAVLITGSAYGVYDDVPWMRDAKDWIGFVAEVQTPLLGICFGHQLIADALGGTVRKSEKGWGIGRHRYDIVKRPDWLPMVPETFSVGVSHQDQVVTPPPDARVFAQSEFAPFAALEYGRGPILTFQGHPEFSDRFLTDLYQCRVGTRFTQDEVDLAVSSFQRMSDNQLIAQWMVSFLETHNKKAVR